MSKMNITEMPEASMKALARAAMGGLEGFYADPDNRKRFEVWKKERDEDGKAGKS